jgi:hypothetical protein
LTSISGFPQTATATACRGFHPRASSWTRSPASGASRREGSALSVHPRSPRSTTLPSPAGRGAGGEVTAKPASSTDQRSRTPRSRPRLLGTPNRSAGSFHKAPWPRGGTAPLPDTASPNGEAMSKSYAAWRPDLGPDGTDCSTPPGQVHDNTIATGCCQ